MSAIIREFFLAWIFLVAFISPFSVLADEEKVISLYYYDRPPYYYMKNGELSGGAWYGLGEYIFKHANIPYKWKIRPTSRIMQEIKEGSYFACSIGWWKTKERETFSLFSAPIYQDPAQVAIVRNDNSIIKTSTLEELLKIPGIRIIRKKSISNGVYIEEQLQKHKETQVIYTSVEHNDMLRMILAKRADAMFITPVGINRLFESANIYSEKLKVIRLSDVQPLDQRHVMCDKSVPIEYINSINESIKTIPKEWLMLLGELE